jgi:hypothetical protein
MNTVDVPAVLGRIWAMLSAADQHAAEMVEINENANWDDPPAPTAPVDSEIQYQLEGGHDGVCWDVCAVSRDRDGLARAERRCPHRYHRVVLVTREILEGFGRA